MPAIEDLLRNCQKYKDELQMEENLKGAVEEYKTLLKKAKEIDCKVRCVACFEEERTSIKDLRVYLKTYYYSGGKSVFLLFFIF